jgi:cell division GTPase FtsZ
VLKNAVGGIAEIINEYGHVNVDFEDVRTVMGEPGKAMMGTAKAAGPTVPASLPSRPWPARCWKASTCPAPRACWCW